MCIIARTAIDICILDAYLMGKIDDTANDRCMQEVARLIYVGFPGIYVIRGRGAVREY